MGPGRRMVSKVSLWKMPFSGLCKESPFNVLHNVQKCQNARLSVPQNIKIKFLVVNRDIECKSRVSSSEGHWPGIEAKLIILIWKSNFRLALQNWKSPNALLLVFCIFYIYSCYVLRQKNHFMFEGNVTNIIWKRFTRTSPSGKLKATQPEGNYRWLAWGEVQLGKASDTSLVQKTPRDI